MKDMVRLTKKAIVIELPLSALTTAIEGMWMCGGSELRWKITDRVAFAKDVVAELSREEEDGSTAVHRLFDSIFMEAIEAGAEGIEEHPDQQDGSEPGDEE